MIRRLLGVLVLLAVLAAAFLAWREIDRMVFGGGDDRPGEAVQVRIPEGAGLEEIAGILEEAGVVDSAFRFEARLTLGGDGDAFKPGTYTLAQNESYDVIVETLNEGPPAAPLIELVVPEGFAQRDIAAEVQEKLGIPAADYTAAVRAAEPPPGFLRKGEKAPRKEGFLFPATYELPEDVTAAGVVERQLDAFEQNWAGLDMKFADSRGLTPYDVLIIASMVEREAAASEDRAKIAGVIYNRLREDMPLGIDPTIQYAVGSWRELTAKDLEVDSPYNTRKVKGLPPTPIANPGLASMKAAANPAKTDALYFVAIPGDPQRRHYFTASYEDFLRFQEENPPE